MFIIILFATVPWLPESPRWLISRGRIDEAEKILADLESTDTDDPYIITQSKDIQWAVQFEKENAVRWRDLLRGRTGDQAGTHTIRRLLLGMGTQAMQQLCTNPQQHTPIRENKTDDLRSRHQRNIVLPPHRPNRLRRPLQQPRPPPRSLQLGLVPALLDNRDPQRRALGPSQNDDVRRRRPVLLLRHHHRLHPVQRARVHGVRDAAAVGEGLNRLLFLVLCLLWHRVAGHAVVVSY